MEGMDGVDLAKEWEQMEDCCKYGNELLVP
jgi:hypothetical protein